MSVSGCKQAETRHDADANRQHARALCAALRFAREPLRAMNQLASIRIFAKVAECLNFAEAAKQLGMSNSVVTRALATLEEHLGVRLLNRTTRRVSLTAPGELYRERCTALLKHLDEMDECMATVMNQPAGSLRIAASSLFASTDLPALLTAYHVDYPQTSFELTVFDNLADIEPMEFDVCFSAERRLRDSTLVCRPLAHTRDRIVASPAYLARRCAPLTPAELTAHDILIATDAPSRYWEFLDANGTQRVVVQPLLNVQSPQVIKRAVLAGLGIARLSGSMVGQELANGGLCALLTDVTLCGDERTAWLLYSGQPHRPVAIRRFIDFVVDRYREASAQSNANGEPCVGAKPHSTSNTELLRDKFL